MIYMCYLDESGVQENTGTTHFVLVGLAIPADMWKQVEKQVTDRKGVYGLENAEIHTAWMARRYFEQEQIPSFAALNKAERIRQTKAKRDEALIRIAARGSTQDLKDAKKNFRKTEAYIHLTHAERRQVLVELANIIGGWQEARLFAEVLDKRHVYSGTMHQHSPFEYAFTELVQRFEYFLKNRGNAFNQSLLGMLIQDNNPTISQRLTGMMRHFHRQGTRWTHIGHIIETPLFVDSHLTSMVQMADVCGYAIRRCFENGETDLFNRIFSRFDRAGSKLVGIHHFTADGCTCRVCHGRR